MASNKTPIILLHTGQRMPLIGLGTWQSKPEETALVIETALNVGYRHIDTAFNYHNEEAIGNALKQWMESGKGDRQQLFVVTKLPHIGMRAEDVSRYLTMSLKRLQLQYLDLYLVHLPFGFIADATGTTPALTPEGGPVIDMTTDHVAIWKEMEKEVDAGRVRAIGISNFNSRQISRIMACARIRPAVLQVELHGAHQQRPLRAFCSELGLPIVAYSPLASPSATTHFKDKYGHIRTQPCLLDHPTVMKVAEAHQKSPAQILLRHSVQQGIGVIPKSANPARIKENFQIFDFHLTGQEMQSIDELDMGNKGRIFDFLFFKG